MEISMQWSRNAMEECPSFYEKVLKRTYIGIGKGEIPWPLLDYIATLQKLIWRGGGGAFLKYSQLQV